MGALKELSEDKFPGDLVYPWGGERGDIVKLVEYFIEHDIEHQNALTQNHVQTLISHGHVRYGQERFMSRQCCLFVVCPDTENSLDL